MTENKYQHAEDEYFKLRGQFDTGRITQEQFDEKLRALMIQDEQGRYWMLGADSGKWYFYDGAKWVQGMPAIGAAAAVAGAPLPEHEASAPPVSVKPAAVAPAPAIAERKGLPIVPILIVLALLVLGVAAFLIFQNRERIFVAQQPPGITPVLPPTITRAPSPTAGVIVPTASLPTLAPLATNVQPTAIPPTLAPTQPAATGAPAVTVIVVTAVPPTPETLPTLLPSATIAQPTAAPATATVTKIPATATQTKIPSTNAPSAPPNVYVTKIEYSPATPKRNQDVTFTATFLNTTGETKYYNWLILLYDPEKTGNNKGFGESPATDITIPTGDSKFSVTFTPVNGPGGCKSLYARAGWKISPFDKPLFPSTGSEPTTIFFDVCP